MADKLKIEKLLVGFNPHRVRMCIYGESGVGKTVFASTWPKTIFLDVDDGMASVERPCSRVEITHFDELYDMHDYLENSPHHYRTVVLDSLNEIQKLAMDKTMEEFPNIRRSYSSMPSESDYGKMLYDYEDLIRKFKRLQMNVLYLCQVTSKQFDTDVIQPDLIGKKSARNLTRMMDIVGYIYKAEDDVQTRIMAFDAAEYVTKDRSRRLPPVIESPTHAAMMRYWKAIEN